VPDAQAYHLDGDVSLERCDVMGLYGVGQAGQGVGQDREEDEKEDEGGSRKAGSKK